MKGLYFLINTDTSAQPRLMEIVQEAIRGGIAMLQWRHKSEYTEEFLALSRRLQLYCRKANVLFIVNDRVDVALQLDSDGVHLGQQDMPIAEARQILGRDKIIGGTAATLAQALQVEKDGADYVSLGHIFPTQSKIKTYPPLGVGLLKQVVDAVTIPVFAIGGIKATNLPDVWATGVDGVAVISEIASAPDPYTATVKLRSLLC